MADYQGIYLGLLIETECRSSCKTKFIHNNGMLSLSLSSHSLRQYILISTYLDIFRRLWFACIHSFQLWKYSWIFFSSSSFKAFNCPYPWPIVRSYRVRKLRTIMSSKEYELKSVIRRFFEHSFIVLVQYEFENEHARTENNR